MKERWSLIQSGQNKKDIKIQGTKLYLKGNIYGSVVGSKFVNDAAMDKANQTMDTFNTN